jgi:hypothetical protein
MITGETDAGAGAAPAPKLNGAVWRERLREAVRLRPSALFHALRRDRLLAIVTALLALVTLSPLFATPFLPLADLPANAAQGALLPSIIFKHGLAAYHYKIQWAPVPYWTTHLIMAFLSPVFGALLATKMMVGIVVLALPLAVMRVLLALGRDLRLGLWAFLLSWDHNTYAGWCAYMLGMSMSLWAIAWLIEAKGPRGAIRVAILAALVGITHIEAVAYLGLMFVFLVFARRPFKTALLTHFIACCGFAVTVLPWIVERAVKNADQARLPFSFDIPPLSEKLASFFKYTLDNQPKPEDTFYTAMAFLLLTFGVAMLASLAGPTEAPPELADAPRIHPATAPLLVFVPLLLYLTLPMAVSGPISHWYTYPRYATFTLASLLFLPRARFGGFKAAWLVPGVLCVIACHSKTAVQFADYGTRARPFLEIIANVKPNSAYLPLELDDSDPATKLATFNQIHSYVAAVKQGYDPHLFDNDAIPFLYRQSRRLPQTAWNAPGAFTLKDHGRYYDYVIIQGGLNRDPLAHLAPAAHIRAKLITEAGRFRLYAMEKY